MPDHTRTAGIATAAAPGDADFLADFTTWSSFGATERGGLHRMAATAAHGQARRWLLRRLTESGAETRVDVVGNVFGVFEWLPGAPFVLLGSHSDSQPHGGRFDGAYGVLAALHAAARLDRAVADGLLEPVRNVAVVDWFNEEGARFQPSLMGSGVHIGKFTAAEVLATADRSGTTVAEALATHGVVGDDPAPPTAAYAEIHIEQGRVLESTGTDIGLVTANWAVRKYTVVVHGEQAHTGATSMADRSDALVGAARVVLAAREVPDGFPVDTVLSAVGRFHIEPNSPVVVPARVTVDVDLRAADEPTLDLAHTRFTAALAAITPGGVRVEITACALRPATPYPPAGVELAAEVVAAAGLSSRRMLTRAGHDSINLKDMVPTVMLFVPSADGISHSEREFTADRDLLNGLDVLTGVARRLVTGELPGGAI